MAVDERNFRSSYYGKVGFKSVEEKKSLEILLKDKPLDRTKLRLFCLRFTVPEMYRNVVWKVLLDIVPIHIDSHTFVMKERKQEYSDLLHALQVMRFVNTSPGSVTSKPRLFLLMWLLETGHLKYDWASQLETDLNQCLSVLVHSLLYNFEDDVDVYWISKGFFRIVDRFRGEVPQLVRHSRSILEKEDLVLYAHLADIGALEVLPMRQWFYGCFAGVLSDSALSKVWDKIVGGAYKILVFVGVVFVITFRRTLLKSTTADEVRLGLDGITDDLTQEFSEVIVNKGLELWLQYGSLGTGLDNVKTRLKTSN